ncbi:hypothetical protein AJ78_08238 [Emergomyces pasteurianus Ep9510]|uniref:Large ribosomal subunit protein P1 n=1 Tax=Emergomyces pasteurianus Ep9510 TaxID=1447872 RepID=A0A1J9Q4L9_9EURO|nr:hypothetical protein AJ78_08238 [Emergomyces pasteurianus Ep9510]
MSSSELAVSYAALILADDGVDITSDKLQSILKAANVNDVEPIWSSLFAKEDENREVEANLMNDFTIQKALEGKDVKDLLLNVGSGGGAAAAATGGAAPVAAEGGAAEEKKEEKEEDTSG